MKKYNNFLYLILTIFMFLNITTVNGECSNSEITTLKKYAANINFSYDYYIENDTAYFNIIVNNLVPQLYIYDEETDTDYFFEDTYDGEFVISGLTKERGEIQILSNLDNCFGEKIGVKNYILPSYNKYYSDNICEKNKEHSLCQKWKKNNFTYEEFKKIMEDYEKTKLPKQEFKEEEKKYEHTLLDYFVDFYVKYYYIILSLIIMICIIIMIISARKNKFNL